VSQTNDPQRLRIYKAEDEAGLVQTEKLPQLEQVGAFVDEVFQSDLLFNNYYFAIIDPVWVGDGNESCHARGSAVGIYLPEWARTKGMILHELAHVVTRRNKNWLDEEPHGWRFAGLLLDMVTTFVGVDIGNGLREAYVRNNVCWTSS